MKKDVSLIRNSIGKIVALLTNQSINVTQRGTKAYVQYHAKTGAIKLVNIPYLPDDASEEFISAVQGFLDHEVGHVLYTDPNVVKKLRKESPKVKNLVNAIEDVYIERKMAQAFTGSTGNLNSVRRFYLDRVAKPKIDDALAAGDMNAAAGYACLVQFRAWGGQQMAENFLTDNPKYAKLTEPLAKKLGSDLIEKIKKANSSKECLDLARAMCKKLEEAPPPPSSESGCSKDSSGSPTDKPGKDDGSSEEPPHSDEKPDDDKPEAEDEGSVRAEVDDSGKKRDEKSESDIEDVPPEAGTEGGEDGGDRKDDDSGEPEESAESEPGESEPESRDTGEDKGESGSGESDEDDGAEEEKPEDGLSISDEGADKDGEEDGDGGSSETDGEGGKDMAESAPDKSKTKGKDEKGSEDEPPEEFDPFDAERDFDDDMGRALTEAAVTEVRGSSYQIFSTDWDKVEPAPMCNDSSAIERMVDATQHMIASIQKSLERAISAKDRKTWNPGQRRGRIAPGALFRTVVGDDRVFRKRYETHAKNTAVTLLVDCSGSMWWGNKIQVAGMAAFALSSTLERLKVTNEVIGFTTRAAPSMTSAMKSESVGVSYARTESIYMPVFKGFGERLGVDAKSRIAHLTERPNWLRENVDGECLKIAATRLKQQRAERHVLIVLSDGSPACPGDHKQLAGHLKATARELDKDSGVEVIGVGIMDASVRKFYDKQVVLNDLSELPTTLIAELSKVLLAP